MESEYGGSGTDEVSGEPAGLLEEIKAVNRTTRVKVVREERKALIAETSGGSASEKEAALRAPAATVPTPGLGARPGMYILASNALTHSRPNQG